MNKNKNSLEANNRKSVAITAVIFLLPVILFLAVYVLYPIIDTFVISTYKWNGISANRDFVGLKNWKRLLEDTKFWAAFWHNIVIMIVSVVIQIPLGLALATFLNFFTKKVRISRVFKTVWFFPYLMSSVAIGFLFTYALATNGGIISTISGWFGGQNIDLLGNPKTALLTIILIVSWQFTPFYMVYCMAGYSGICGTGGFWHSSCRFGIDRKGPGAGR